MVYSCSPFLNEFDLLNLKISEELDIVDEIYLIESNQTLHCNYKPLNLKGKYKENSKVHCCFIENKFQPNKHAQNDTIQKNSILGFFDYKDKDILICSDLDEINNRKDIPRIIDETKKHGFIKLQMHCYYYKINLQRDTRKGWRSSFSITGKELRKNNGNIYKLRKVIDTTLLNTNGKHFSYLSDPQGISYKISNAGHPEFMKEYFTNPEKIKERINNQQDLFDRLVKQTGEIQKLVKVPIDDTYPQTILNNLEFWGKYIA